MAYLRPLVTLTLDHFLDVFQSEIERTPIGLVLFLFKINGKLCVLELRLYLCFTFRSLDQVYILEETGNLRVLYTFLSSFIFTV
jgi:hypothetical protein